MKAHVFAFVLSSLASVALAQTPSGVFSEKQSLSQRKQLQLMRDQWFTQQRATPEGYIPSWLLWQAGQELDRMMAREKQLGALGTTIILATPWVSIGPSSTSGYWGPATGRVLAMLVDPRNANVVYAGTQGGGVWKTSDAGSTWAPLSDNQPSLGAAALAFNPSNLDTIYVGTGGDYGAGVLKSTNGGKTWTNYPGPFVGPFGSDNFFGGSARISSIAVSPANPNSLLVGDFAWPESNAGVYASADGGQTWTQKLSGTPGHTVAFDPNDGTIAYAALCGGYGPPYGGANAGIYKSVDGGDTWNPVTGTGTNVLPPSDQIADCQIVIQKSNTSILYATINFVDRSYGLFKSTDAGLNWRRLADPPVTDVFYSDPNNPNVLFAGGVHLYRSVDGGHTWVDISNGANVVVLHPDQHSYGFSSDASKLYVGNDGGISSTTDISSPSVNWTNLNHALADEMIYPGVAINRLNKQIAFSGSQDNGMQRDSGSQLWQEVACGDGGYAAIDPANSNNVYIACIYTDIEKSSTGGISGFAAANNGINTSDRANFISPLVMDPSNSQRLYFGTYRVYQTTDATALWTAISPDLTTGGVLNTIGVSPADPNVVYAGSTDGTVSLTKTALSGTASTWSTITSGLPPRAVSQVIPDPHNANIAYAIFSGFSGFGDSLGHVFKTLHRGGSWHDVSGNLPNVPATSIVVDPALANTLYVSTDIGVFSTRNGGATWSPLMNGFPKAVTTFLALDSHTRTLRAATYGRSIFDAHLPLADLSLSMTESPNPIRHGTNFTYTIRVGNNGPDTATNLAVTDPLPNGSTFVSVTPSTGTCSHPTLGATGTVNCPLGNLAKGSTATVKLVLRDTAAARSTLTNSAKGLSAIPDQNPGNNVVTLKTPVR
jgi:uncharacterized repeat protein (TIGR01451 family)